MKYDRINSNDVDILNNASSDKFKYGLLYSENANSVIIKFANELITELWDELDNLSDDNDNYYDDAFEMTYPGDRDSPPEYELTENAVMVPALDECILYNGKLKTVSNYITDETLFLFSDLELLKYILKDIGYELKDIYNSSKIDIECSDKKIIQAYVTKMIASEEGHMKHLKLNKLRKLALPDDVNFSDHDINNLFN